MEHLLSAAHHDATAPLDNAVRGIGEEWVLPSTVVEVAKAMSTAGARAADKSEVARPSRKRSPQSSEENPNAGKGDSNARGRKRARC